MRKIVVSVPTLIATILCLTVSIEAYAYQFPETLSQYVATCKSQLGFTSIPDLDCHKGTLFKDIPLTPILDYIGHARANGNDNVDVVFACRWANGTATDPNKAQSVEMIVHNRANGNTCFFLAKDDGTQDLTKKIVPTAITSPTSANASTYWQDPSSVNSHAICVNCHVGGAYIASDFAVFPLVTFGLINDTHDTFGTKFHVVGTTFSSWNTIRKNNATAGCAGSCHVLAKNNPPEIAKGGFTVIPSIHDVQTQILNQGLMPANNSPYNDYRWVNMDSPTYITSTHNGDYESLIQAWQLFPTTVCSSPTSIQAMVVDDAASETFGIMYDADPYILPPTFTDVRDRLHQFNLRDGLVCFNSEQNGGRSCHDYETSYLCNGQWTDFYNADVGDQFGDHEERSKVPGLCATPKAIKARFPYYDDAGNRYDQYMYGPPDRLAEFDNGGLRCNNADQGTGNRCSNYTVRFMCN